MDTAGWIQVLSIIGSLLAILGIFWKVAMMYSKIKSKADRANIRLDDLEKDNKVREDTCPMREKITEYGIRIKDIEKENKETAIKFEGMDKKLDYIVMSIDELKDRKKNEE
jgi:hypothetical protein